MTDDGNKHKDDPKPGTPNPSGDGEHPKGKPVPPPAKPGKHGK